MGSFPETFYDPNFFAFLKGWIANSVTKPISNQVGTWKQNTMITAKKFVYSL